MTRKSLRKSLIDNSLSTLAVFVLLLILQQVLTRNDDNNNVWSGIAFALVVAAIAFVLFLAWDGIAALIRRVRSR